MRDIYFYLNNEDTVGDLRHRFSRIFPELSLNVYEPCPDRESSPQGSIPFCPQTVLAHIHPGLRQGGLRFKETETIKEMEQQLFDRFGLQMQVRNQKPGAAENLGLARLSEFVHQSSE